MGRGFEEQGLVHMGVCGDDYVVLGMDDTEGGAEGYVDQGAGKEGARGGSVVGYMSRMIRNRHVILIKCLVIFRCRNTLSVEW